MTCSVPGERERKGKKRGSTHAKGLRKAKTKNRESKSNIGWLKAENAKYRR